MKWINGVKWMNWRHMKRAVDLARRSVAEDNKPHPKVGAVIVTVEGKKFEGYRGQLDAGDHAEFIALEKIARPKDLTGATLYTTLEPCTTRKHPKVPCAQRIVDNRIRKVWIGMLDPNPDIYGKGLRLLESNGIEWEFFPARLRTEIKEINEEFISSFSIGAHLVKHDYWSVADVINCDVLGRQWIANILWGERARKGDHGTTVNHEESLQFDKIQAARESQKCARALAMAEKLFPNYGEMDIGVELDKIERQKPVGLRGISLKTIFQIRNASSSKASFRFRPVTGTLDRSEEPYGGALIDYQVSSSEQDFVAVGRHDSIDIPVEVTVRYDFRNGRFASHDALFQRHLRLGQALKDEMLQGISGLEFEIMLMNGDIVRRPFGLRIIDGIEQIDRIETIDVDDFLEEWREIDKCYEEVMHRYRQGLTHL